MASKLINLNQLKIAVASVKNYADNVYAKDVHTHDELYPTFKYVDAMLIELEEKLADKADVEHTHESNSIYKMTDYVIAEEVDSIYPSDSLNVAIGKLEAAVYQKASETHNHDGVYMRVGDTADAAKQLEHSVAINLSGAVTGSTTFDGSTDVQINTSISAMPSNKITSMSGYAKHESIEAIEETDSLNVAIGKLEAALDSKQDVGTSDIDQANAYTDEKIAELVGGTDIPDSLNTLREIASALNDDPNFHNTINAALQKKADKEHSHDLVTSEAAGFMSSDDKIKIDTIELHANNYKHPTTAGNKHIPAGGESGQILTWSNDGTAEWALMTPTSASDTDVENMLNELFTIKK